MVLPFRLPWPRTQVKPQSSNANACPLPPRFQTLSHCRLISARARGTLEHFEIFTGCYRRAPPAKRGNAGQFTNNGYINSRVPPPPTSTAPKADSYGSERGALRVDRYALTGAGHGDVHGPRDGAGQAQRYAAVTRPASCCAACVECPFLPRPRHSAVVIVKPATDLDSVGRACAADRET